MSKYLPVGRQAQPVYRAIEEIVVKVSTKQPNFNFKRMDIWSSFYYQLLETTWLEFIAVICGILSVWFSKQEKILVYPFGIVSVVIFVYLTYEYG
ncbi:MAG: nicotinamide mononucleotide transporter, partial [Ekhidna sp.]